MKRLPQIKNLSLFSAFLIVSSQLLGQVYQIDNVNGMTINTCSGTFYDSEQWDLVPGSGDFYYDDNEQYEVTFCSSVPGSALVFDFSEIGVTDGDTLWVYDGPSTASPMVAAYNGGYGMQTVIGFSGCLTFLFISDFQFVSTGWQGTFSCLNIPLTPLQPSCTNISFESGNFNGWYGTYGIPALTIPAAAPVAMNTGAPGAPTPNYFPDVYGSTTAPHHTITSGAGVDPYGGFPVVSPSGGTNSVMLGDFDNPYFGGCSIEQKFTVTPSNAMMVYSYAVVIQDAAAGGVPHASNEQPYFQIEAFDCSGNSIPCGDYLVVGGAAIPGFSLAPGFLDVYYKPWTDVFLDLSPYVGSCVTVRFTQGDCTLGAHFSYVYLDATCGPLEIIGPQYICPGEFVTLEAPLGGAGYLWTPGGQTTSSITVSPAVYTDYTCTVTPVTGPACNSVLDYWVDVYPPASVTVNSDSICDGTSITLVANPNSAGGNMLWNPTGLTTDSITVSPATSTNYIVTFTDINGCTASDTAVVVTSNSVYNSTVTICQGESAQIFGNSETTSGVYSNSFIIPGMCDSIVNITLVVNPLPNVFAGNDVVICEGGQILLTASGAPNLVWNNGVTNGQLFTPATGYYTVIGTDANGCVNTDSLLVTVAPSPDPLFTVDVSDCEPFIATFTNLTPGIVSNCVWQISNNTVLNGCGPLTYTFPNAGTYDVTLTTTSPLGCVASVTYFGYVNLLANPIASFNPGLSNLTTINTGIQFNNTSTGSTNYVWTFGDGSAASTLVNPYHVFPDDEAAGYLITLIAYSPLGCTDTAYATVMVDEEILFYVPNTFTPDGDNYNQYFKAIFTSGYDPYDFHLLIFNRWGEIIWESFDDKIGWDGTYADQIVQDGTYTWKIDFKRSKNDERIFVVGHVNIIR